GVTARGVSAYPAEVTAQMVTNFAAGGAAIKQLARAANAELRVIALDLERPTADFAEAPAMTEAKFLEAVVAGYKAVPEEADLVVLGEMGIGNTTAAAAVAAALFGGGGSRFAGHGTGLDEEGLRRKQVVIDDALARHAPILDDPLRIAAALGGRELAALLGACLAARHARVGHRSAEAGHRLLLDELGLHPLLDLDMRLGEGSGAAVAVLVLRAALA